MGKIYLLLIIFSVLLCVGCVREMDKFNINQEIKGKPLTFLSNGSNTLSYGASIYYLCPNVSVLSPIQRPDEPGIFSSSPGLSIDHYTGKIDLIRSETGMWFTIKFTSLQGRVYKTRLMISGIEYESAVYDLSSIRGNSNPYYNASQQNPMPRGRFSSSDQSVIVNPQTGAIDLLRTANNIPVGDFKEVTISYGLNDPSNNTPNRIVIRVYRYRRKEDIPNFLLSKVQQLSGARMQEEMVRERPPVVVVAGG